MKIQKLYRKNRIRFTAAALSISMLAALPGCSAGGNKNAEDVSSSAAAESMSETADESTPEDTSNTTEVFFCTDNTGCGRHYRRYGHTR